MGNANSSNQSGGNIEEVQSKVELFIEKIMKDKVNDINNRKFCNKIEIVLKNNILGALRKDELKDINNNIGIGYKLDDKVSKKEICDKLSKYYLKKIEVSKTIKTLLEMISTKINNINTMSRCVADKNRVSNIKYGDNKKWKTLPKELLNSINFSQIRKDMFKNIGLDPSEFYYVIEIDNKEECENFGNGGRWLSGLKQLETEGLIPPKELDNYNKKYQVLIDSINNKQVSTINSLSNLFAKICKEEQTTVPVSGGKTKRKNALTELPISFKELLQIEKDIIDIISKDIVALETLYLELYSLDIVTKKDIETFENDKKKLEELQNKLNKKELGFNNTN